MMRMLNPIAGKAKAKPKPKPKSKASKPKETTEPKAKAPVETPAAKASKKSAAEKRPPGKVPAAGIKKAPSTAGKKKVKQGKEESSDDDVPDEGISKDDNTSRRETLEKQMNALLDNLSIDDYYYSHADKPPPEHILNEFDKDPRAMKVRYTLSFPHRPPHLSFPRISSVSSFSLFPLVCFIARSYRSVINRFSLLRTLIHTRKHTMA